jgi:hypothetical protein
MCSTALEGRAGAGVADVYTLLRWLLIETCEMALLAGRHARQVF